MKRKLTLLLACLFMGIGLVIAQTQKVTGVVISEEDGQPVVGASVLVKGTNQGTITNVDGNFTLQNIPSSAKTLQVSYIGMQTQEVGVKPTLRIVLKADAQQIDEVMVVAYGTAKKSSFTGSASVMKSGQLEKRQVANVTNALVGQVAGVQVTQNTGQPGTTSTIHIRGIGSMAASNAPLFVVDGVPFDGDISSINPADIASTTVLKDAASNALYGARGANGVVLITTKKGQTGDAVISVDVKWGTNKRGVPNYDVITNPATYLEKAYEAMYNSKVYATSPSSPADANKFVNANIWTNEGGGVGYPIYTVPKGETVFGLDGKINPKATLGYNDGKNFLIPDDWYKEMFGKGNLRQEYNVNVSGGSDRLDYYASAGYLDDSGIIPNSGFKRYGTRLKADYKAKKYLTVGANVSFTHYDMTSPKDQDQNGGVGNIFYAVNNVAPIYPFYVRDKDKNIMKDSYGFTMYDFGDGRSTDYTRSFLKGASPASLIELDSRKYAADVFSGRWSATFNIIEGLKFAYNLGLDIDNTRSTTLYNAFYGQYAEYGGIISKASSRTFSMNHQQLLTYVKTFNHVHNLDVLIGHESYKYKYEDLSGSKEKLYNPFIQEIDNAILKPDVYSSTDHYGTEGWLSRLQYDYDSKYMISFSYRRDASSRFHKDHRWGNFGSIGGAWVVDREDFMQNFTWIDFLKAKMSYGIQGNDKLLYVTKVVNYYPYQDQFKVVENNGNFAVQQTYKGNKNITWETSYSYNTGVDFSFWKGKLSGTVEYFSRKTTDLLYNKPVAISGGYATFPENIGTVRNSGFEFDLHSDIIKNKDLTLSVYANGTTLHNRIVALAPELKGELKDGTRIYVEGESMYQLYLRKCAGVSEKGVALYYIDETDAKGVVTQKKTEDYQKATKYKTGNILPHVYGGFGLNLAAYGVDFSLSCAYQLGGKVIDYGYRALMHSGTDASAGNAWHKDMLNSWSETNKGSAIPKVDATAQYANELSDRFLTSSDYLNLTNMTLGYTFPKQLINKLQLNHLRVYLSADNLGLWTARKGLDPRQSFTSGESFRYTAIRSFSAGINVKF